MTRDDAIRIAQKAGNADLEKRLREWGLLRFCLQCIAEIDRASITCPKCGKRAQTIFREISY